MKDILQRYQWSVELIVFVMKFLSTCVYFIHKKWHVLTSYCSSYHCWNTCGKCGNLQELKWDVIWTHFFFSKVEYHRATKNLASLGTIRAQLRAHFKPLCTILLWCTGVSGVLDWDTTWWREAPSSRVELAQPHCCRSSREEVPSRSRAPHSWIFRVAGNVNDPISE